LHEDAYAVSTYGIGLQRVGNDARYLGIPCGDDIRIFDITFQETVAGSTHNMWSTVIKNRECLTQKLFAEALPDSTGSICVPVPALRTLILHASPVSNIGSGGKY
jgi:hypothetical protein